MTRFEPLTSDVKSDRSANWATTTAQDLQVWKLTLSANDPNLTYILPFVVSFGMF